jgi:hypothetical protein
MPPEVVGLAVTFDPADSTARAPGKLGGDGDFEHCAQHFSYDAMMIQKTRAAIGAW